MGDYSLSLNLLLGASILMAIGSFLQLINSIFETYFKEEAENEI